MRRRCLPPPVSHQAINPPRPGIVSVALTPSLDNRIRGRRGVVARSSSNELMKNNAQLCIGDKEKTRRGGEHDALRLLWLKYKYTYHASIYQVPFTRRRTNSLSNVVWRGMAPYTYYSRRRGAGPVEQEIFHMITSQQLTSNHNMCDVQKTQHRCPPLFADKIVNREEGKVIDSYGGIPPGFPIKPWEN